MRHSSEAMTMSSEPIVVVVDRDLEDLIPGFINRRNNDVIKLRDALARDDLKTIRVTGHSLKGTGGGYGFDGLSQIGARIEDAARSSDTAALCASLDALEDYLSRVRIEFR